MKLLLHICCAPCAISPLERLKTEGFDEITGHFYNPNIHPYSEYLKRRSALADYSKDLQLPVVFHKYDLENFFRQICGKEDKSQRCRLCWAMRLDETALYGAKNNYDRFTTTLLVSPYQDQDAINEIGEKAANKHGIKFLYRDFRDGFREAQDKAKRGGLYRQKYCGCVFSERERYEGKQGFRRS